MTAWFGNSWGAPACDPEEHVETPVGEPCARCGEPIGHLDQGVSMTFVESIDPPVARVRPTHLDCYLKQILPHGPDCPRCRGIPRDEHKMSCAYRKHGGDCECWRTWKDSGPSGAAAKESRADLAASEGAANSQAPGRAHALGKLAAPGPGAIKGTR